MVKPPRGCRIDHRVLVPGHVCYAYPDYGYACTIQKRVTRTRLVVVAVGCALAVASGLRGVQQACKRVTAGIAIPAGVCNSPARARHPPLSAYAHGCNNCLSGHSRAWMLRPTFVRCMRELRPRDARPCGDCRAAAAYGERWPW
jgi:hypothetical protein